MSLFDVPLHYNFFQASNSNGEFDMRELLKNTLVERDPMHAVTFVDNHDTQTGQALESAIQPWFVPLAYATILLRPQGYPCVFYGNYYGDKAKNGPSFHKEIDLMMDLRRDRVYGAQHDYLDDPDVIGWTMEGDEEHGGKGLAVVLTNRKGDAKAMDVGMQHAGETWIDVLGNESREVVIDEEGYGVFSCKDGSLSIWTLKEDSAAASD
jgi:alpha-amylase